MKRFRITVVKILISLFVPFFIQMNNRCNNCGQEYRVSLNYYWYMKYMTGFSVLGRDLLVCDDCFPEQMRRSAAYVRRKYDKFMESKK